MEAHIMFTTIDTHTGGNPTRTVTSGLPKLAGNSMSEKMLYMKENFDWIRKFLMNEPRGHDVMSGALLTDPCHPDADIGVIYIETGGYLPMCGHDTIGLCTALVETGMIPVFEPFTSLKLDTPAGLVEVRIDVENGRAQKVTFINIGAFHYKSIDVNVTGFGTVSCDIAYGGNFYGLVDARKLNLELTPENSTKIVDIGIRIRNTINQSVEVIHPESPFIHGLTHIEFFTDPTNPEANVKNTVIVPPGGIDRSPCGTGTSAKLAVLYAKKQIAINERFVHESIVGTLFEAKVLEEVKVGPLDGVVTEISGKAWLMGIHKFFYNPEDPLSEGFLLIPSMDGH